MPCVIFLLRHGGREGKGKVIINYKRKDASYFRVFAEEKKGERGEGEKGEVFATGWSLYAPCHNAPLQRKEGKKRKERRGLPCFSTPRRSIVIFYSYNRRKGKRSRGRSYVHLG